jgi:hypothetical protein
VPSHDGCLPGCGTYPRCTESDIPLVICEPRWPLAATARRAEDPTSETSHAVTSGTARQLHGVETLAHAYVIKSVQSYQAEEFNTVNSTDTR